MSDITAIIADSARRWPIANIVPARLAEVNATAKRLVAPAAKARYIEISIATGVPWFVIAVIHERECGQNWNQQLGQGDPLDQISRHVPRGRGPFLNHPGDPPLQDAFYRAAVDALQNCAPYAARWKDWSVGGTLALLITYNGTGYEDYHNEISPYDWGATDQEQEGKYTGDGAYSKNVWDTQIGCAAMLKEMIMLDPSIQFGGLAAPVPLTPSAPAPTAAPLVTDPHDTAWVQASLNKLMGLKLAVDGDCGPQTTAAVRTFQRVSRLQADGVVGPLTIAAIEKDLEA